MMWRVARICFVLIGLNGSVALAQGMRGGGSRAGGSGQQPGGKPSPQQSSEEQNRAANAKQWADDIEKMRAQAPPPPMPTIRFPTENEKLLSRLRWAEDPKKELALYLDKLWKDAKEPAKQRVALEGFWHDAEKPKWARAAIEDYFRKHMGDGGELRAPPEPADVRKPPATASATPPPAPAPATPPASATGKPPAVAADR